jgi:rfaE bifunctional protein kinase chain/domain
MTGTRSGRILVVGDCMVDRYWTGDVHRISPEAPVPVVQMTDQSDRLGGAANVALNAQSIGAEVALMGVLGDDEAARSFLDMLSARGIGNHLLQDEKAGTIVKLRVVSHRQQLLRLDFEKRTRAATAEQLVGRFEQAVGQSDCVIFSDYDKGALANVRDMIGVARRQHKIVVVDPKGRDYERYAGADVITPNQGELALVTGAWHDEDDLARKAFGLRAALGIRSLLLTRSEKGMSLFTEQDGAPLRVDFAAETREVFDVTGAGDTVIATLAVMLAEGRPLTQATELANCAAGLVVRKFGTSTVSRAELAAAAPVAVVGAGA